MAVGAPGLAKYGDFKHREIDGILWGLGRAKLRLPGGVCVQSCVVEAEIRILGSAHNLIVMEGQRWSLHLRVELARGMPRGGPLRWSVCKMHSGVHGKRNVGPFQRGCF